MLPARSTSSMQKNYASIVYGLKIKDLFAECDSPSLIQLYDFSCDFKVIRFDKYEFTMLP